MSARPLHRQHHPPLLSSLRWRLSAAISGVVLLCTAVCVAGAVLFLRQALTDRARADVQRTLTGVSGYLDNQGRDLRGAAELVSADPGVQAAVAAGNRQGLILRLTPFYADLSNADVMDVIDARGRVLVRMEDTTDSWAYGDAVGDRPSVRAALAGREVTAFEADLPGHEEANGYALRATVPLRRGSRVVGAVVVGQQLDSPYAARIGRALSSDVNLIAGNQRTGTTLTDSNGLPAAGLPEPRSVLDRIARGTPSIAVVREDGQATLSGLVPLAGPTGRPVGAVEVVSRLGPLYDLITQLSYLLLALGAGAVVAGTLLALGIGRRLTARLLALEATAAHVAAMAGADAPLGHLHDAVAVRGDDEVASLARSFGAMMTALDERIAANARLYAAAQARVRELSGLAEIARLLTAAPSFAETLDRLGEHVCRLVGCSGVALLLPGAGAAPAVYGGHGLPDGYAELIDDILAGAGDDGYQLASQIALKHGRVVSHRVDAIPESHAALRELMQSMGWGGVTTVPLLVQGRAIGTMSCYTAADSPLSDSDLGLLTTIADQVAVAVENARLHAHSRDVAALEERARLARELHDSVTQALFSTTLHARAAQMALERGGIDPTGALGRSVRQLSELTQGALAEMRALIFELRPGALAEEGLAAALRKQAAALSAREGLAIEVDAPAERLTLGADVEEHLYRLAQEALHNVVKHAQAGRAVVRLATHDGTSGLILEIGDDGVGFDTTEVRPGHLGLGTMAERARQIGGTIAFDSAPGRGTTVRVIVPGPAPDVHDRTAALAASRSGE